MTLPGHKGVAIIERLSTLRGSSLSETAQTEFFNTIGWKAVIPD